MWHLLRISIISVIFLQKKEVSFEVSSFGGLLFSGRLLLSGFANTCDILSLLSKVCYSQGLLLSELYGSWTIHLSQFFYNLKVDVFE